MPGFGSAPEAPAGSGLRKSLLDPETRPQFPRGPRSEGAGAAWGGIPNLVGGGRAPSVPCRCGVQAPAPASAPPLGAPAQVAPAERPASRVRLRSGHQASSSPCRLSLNLNRVGGLGSSQPCLGSHKGRSRQMLPPHPPMLRPHPLRAPVSEELAGFTLHQGVVRP